MRRAGRWHSSETAGDSANGVRYDAGAGAGGGIAFAGAVDAAVCAALSPSSCGGALLSAARGPVSMLAACARRGAR
jgi:hypothetical protein